MANDYMDLKKFTELTSKDVETLLKNIYDQIKLADRMPNLNTLESRKRRQENQFLEEKSFIEIQIAIKRNWEQLLMEQKDRQFFEDKQRLKYEKEKEDLQLLQSLSKLEQYKLSQHKAFIEKELQDFFAKKIAEIDARLLLLRQAIAQIKEVRAQLVSHLHVLTKDIFANIFKKLEPFNQDIEYKYRFNNKSQAITINAKKLLHLAVAEVEKKFRNSEIEGDKLKIIIEKTAEQKIENEVKQKFSEQNPEADTKQLNELYSDFTNDSMATKIMNNGLSVINSGVDDQSNKIALASSVSKHISVCDKLIKGLIETSELLEKSKDVLANANEDDVGFNLDDFQDENDDIQANLTTAEVQIDNANALVNSCKDEIALINQTFPSTEAQAMLSSTTKMHTILSGLPNVEKSKSFEEKPEEPTESKDEPDAEKVIEKREEEKKENEINQEQSTKPKL